MIRIKKIDHVAVCVADLDAAIAQYRDLFSVEPTSRERVDSQKTDAALLPIGECQLELIAPAGNQSLEKFLVERGPGLHHVALEVDDIDKSLAFLKALGVRLIDDVPRIGARGHRVAFIHPRATGGVLIELVENS